MLANGQRYTVTDTGKVVNGLKVYAACVSGNVVLGTDFDARITAQSGTSNVYSFVQIEDRTAPNNWTVVAGGITGTANAEEVNGNASVPTGASTGAIVRMRPSATSGWFEFDYQASSTPVNLQWVHVTGTSSASVTLSGGSVQGWPAKLSTQDPATAAWTDGATVWYLPVNGQAPIAGYRYQCRLFGADTSGVAIWESASPRGCAYATNIGVNVQSVTMTDGSAANVYTCDANGQSAYILSDIEINDILGGKYVAALYGLTNAGKPVYAASAETAVVRLASATSQTVTLPDNSTLTAYPAYSYRLVNGSMAAFQSGYAYFPNGETPSTSAYYDGRLVSFGGVGQYVWSVAASTAYNLAVNITIPVNSTWSITTWTIEEGTVNFVSDTLVYSSCNVSYTSSTLVFAASCSLTYNCWVSFCGPVYYCWYTTTAPGQLANPGLSVLPLSGAGPLKGIAAPSPLYPQRLRLINVGSLPFVVQNNAGTANTSILTPNGGDLQFIAQAAIDLDYDTVSNAWRVTSGTSLPFLASKDDATPGYLADKLSGGDVSFSVQSPGGNETLKSTVTALQGIGLSTTAPTSGQVLGFNGTDWGPQNAASSSDHKVSVNSADTSPDYLFSKFKNGDLIYSVVGNSQLQPRVAGIQNVGVVSTAPTLNQILAHNGTYWTPTNLNSLLSSLPGWNGNINQALVNLQGTIQWVALGGC